MINMALNKKDEEYFITDVKFLEDDIVVKYADDHEEHVGFCNDHMKEFYRMKLLEQVRKYVEPFIEEAGKEALRAYIKKYGFIVAEVIEMYVMYNVDIHLIMKIIIGILLTLVNGIMYLAAEGDLLFLSDYVEEAFVLEYYADNYEDFIYLDEETNTTVNALPIEEISHSKINLDTIKQIRESVVELKEENAKNIEVKILKMENKDN